MTTVTIGDVQLEPLKVSAVRSLINSQWTSERERMVDILDVAGASPERREDVLTEHELNRGRFEPLIRYAATYNGACHILKLASIDDDILDKLNGVGVVELRVAACNLIGVDIEKILKEARQQEESGATPPDPIPSPRSTG